MGVLKGDIPLKLGPSYNPQRITDGFINVVQKGFGGDRKKC
jgi:hypothetical protein